MNISSSINTEKSSVLPMVIIGTLFFMFGFVTWLNGSLIPFLQIACELTYLQSYFVTMAFYIAYVFMALPMSAVLRRIGYKNGMVLGLTLMMFGALLFIPAALLRVYGIFLIALFILGGGLTILQTASNPYIVIIGSRETAAVRICVMGILNKLAGVAAPIVFTTLVLSDMPDLGSQFDEARLASISTERKEQELSLLSSQLVTPYLIMAAMLLFLAGFIRLSPLPEPANNLDQAKSSSPIRTILKKPQVVLGFLTLFFYVGAEVIAGDTIGLFGKEAGVTNFEQLTAYTMSFMVFGYLVGIVCIPKLVSQERALLLCALLGAAFAILLPFSSIESSSVWNSLLGWTSVAALPNAVLFIALFGFANAMVWPIVWPLALRGLNTEELSAGAALLVMGIGGGAILPLAYGAIVDTTGDLQSGYWIMLPCYLFILFYAFKGHKIERWPFQ